MEPPHEFDEVPLDAAHLEMPAVFYRANSGRKPST
jgi:hypothetical protein